MTEYGTLLTAYILAVFIIIVKKKKKKMKRQILHRNTKDALMLYTVFKTHIKNEISLV